MNPRFVWNLAVEPMDPVRRVIDITARSEPAAGIESQLSFDDQDFLTGFVAMRCRLILVALRRHGPIESGARRRVRILA